MPRPSWKGALSFGLVSVNVGMYSAVSDHDIGFRHRTVVKPHARGIVILLESDRARETSA